VSRSPLMYAMGRGFDSDAGGAAELQTDVMRFMAILSLCLVAIFALVQSLPPAPVKATTPDISAIPPLSIEEEKPIASPAAVEAKKLAVEAAALEQPIILTRPKPVAADRHVVNAPNPAVVEPVATPIVPEREGFTLQFEDDTALTRLISSKDVGFFAISADKTMRLTIDGSKMNFWPSSTPGQFHEMDGSTVPVEVKRALLRSGAALPGTPQWGVTLPPVTTGQLTQILAESKGGSLIIGSNGEIRLER